MEKRQQKKMKRLFRFFLCSFASSNCCFNFLITGSGEVVERIWRFAASLVVCWYDDGGDVRLEVTNSLKVMSVVFADCYTSVSC